MSTIDRNLVSQGRGKAFLDQFDIEAMREGSAVSRAQRPIFKGKRLLNKPPGRLAQRSSHNEYTTAIVRKSPLSVSLAA